MPKWGKNILENLTTGMYKDSKVAYREYIQNACDQIKRAREIGLLGENEGNVDITIDSKGRNIYIEDDATGIERANFKSQLGDIANSDKKQGEDIGFRGIGRLCGLAYCSTLVFTTSAFGETEKSIMTIDALQMRNYLSSPEKYEADFVIDNVTKFSEAKEEKDKHYFIVEMKNISSDNKDLLDEEKVRNYLSFVAPVPFKNTFRFRKDIYEYANSIGHSIDEYTIRVNGKELFKNYAMRLYEASGNSKKTYDSISGVAFKEFYNRENELLAWMWYGICRFEKSIPAAFNPMKGIRLRQGNIELGDENVLQSLFKEPRGNGYFVGEVYAVTPKLIPNSQRDYFNENATRNEFEILLKRFFYDDLTKLYRFANDVKSNYKKIENYHVKAKKYKEKEQNGFIDDSEKERLENELKEAEEKKNEAKRKLDRIAKKRDEERKDSTNGSSSQEQNSSFGNEEDPLDRVFKEIKKEYEKKSEKSKDTSQQDKKEHHRESEGNHYFTDNLSKLSKKDRKLVSRIMAIVVKHADPNAVNDIKLDITEEFS